MFKIEGKEQKMSLRDKEEVKLSWGGKLIYYNCIVGGAIDARFLPAILKGIMEKMEEGPLTGSYARDIAVYVYDGKMHPLIPMKFLSGSQVVMRSVKHLKKLRPKSWSLYLMWKYLYLQIAWAM